MSQTYKDAGVDIDVGNKFVKNIMPLVKETFSTNVLGDIGSFAGAYELPSGFKQPVMIAATDGVGTKLKLAIESKKFNTVGIDLVAMCVNDLICNFATPLFFLDYYATSKLSIDQATAVISGITKACINSQCSLIGGETAEMPGFYSHGDFDLAGFAVGIAEKSELNRVDRVKLGDKLIALPSSGLHSNGFSLVRKILFEKLNMDFNSNFNGSALIDLLLEPTTLYVQTFKKIKNYISALSHITGGGIIENLPRILPQNMQAIIDKNSIKTLPIFELFKDHVAEDEMFRTFNMGVGMILVVPTWHVKSVLANSNGYEIGEIYKGDKKVVVR